VRSFLVNKENELADLSISMCKKETRRDFTSFYLVDENHNQPSRDIDIEKSAN